MRAAIRAVLADWKHPRPLITDADLDAATDAIIAAIHTELQAPLDAALGDLAPPRPNGGEYSFGVKAGWERAIEAARLAARTTITATVDRST